MSIRAIYENGVFRPLEELSIEQRTEVTIDVYPIEGRKESIGRSLYLFPPTIDLLHRF